MQRFEWDATKDRTNQRKHGFGFRTAARVFEDPNIVLIEDRIDEEGNSDGTPWEWSEAGFS